MIILRRQVVSIRLGVVSPTSTAQVFQLGAKLCELEQVLLEATSCAEAVKLEPLGYGEGHTGGPPIDVRLAEGGIKHRELHVELAIPVGEGPEG